MKPEDCILTPKIGVGPIRFGHPIESLKNVEGFEKVEPDEWSADYEWYECVGCDLDVYGDGNGKIETIGCDETLIFDGKNLVGITLSELEGFLKLKGQRFSDGDEMSDGSIVTGYIFEPLGLRAWVTEEERVESIAADDGDYED